MRTGVVIVGGGPAGLMAAETAAARGLRADVYERMGSVGRKFLLAGKGGLNLTHSDPRGRFDARYGAHRAEVGRWLDAFDADALRAWAGALGVETFVGSSGRVFPSDLKAAPLLRAWLRRLRAGGVTFHVHHRWLGWHADGALRFATPAGEIAVSGAATVLALGGGSWPVLGSDGAWLPLLRTRGVAAADLAPANCGFDVDWSAHFAERHAGAPLKPVTVFWRDDDGVEQHLQGECVVTANGIEGSLIYAISATLRERIAAHGQATIALDLAPGRSEERLARDLARPRNGRSLAEQLRRQAGIGGAKAGLLRECLDAAGLADPQRLAATIKQLPIVLRRPRPLAEAISTAGGVRFDALREDLMLHALPGTFCAGEMIDWEAPTGGYLLTASFASGRIAGAGAADWAQTRQRG